MLSEKRVINRRRPGEAELRSLTLRRIDSELGCCLPTGTSCTMQSAADNGCRRPTVTDTVDNCFVCPIGSTRVRKRSRVTSHANPCTHTHVRAYTPPTIHHIRPRVDEWTMRSATAERLENDHVINQWRRPIGGWDARACAVCVFHGARNQIFWILYCIDRYRIVPIVDTFSQTNWCTFISEKIYKKIKKELVIKTVHKK